MGAFIEIFKSDFAAEVFRTAWSGWFLWLPVALFFVFWELWVLYVQAYFRSKMSWIMLEVKIPPNIFKSPRAMEMVFNVFHMTREGDRIERYWYGFLKNWMSMEIVSIGGDVKFLVYAQKHMKNLIEAQIYAHYPEVEITEVEDYVKSMPDHMPTEDSKMWGAEFGLTKDDALPIRTYIEFKLEDVKEEEEKADPVSSMLEFMGSLREGERVCMQIIIRAAKSDWLKSGAKLRDKIMSRYMGEKGAMKSLMMPPGDKDLLFALENNMNKLGFEVIMRCIYVARNDVFNSINKASITGVLKQYNTSNLNGFKPVKVTSAGFWFERLRERRNQRKMYKAFINRGGFHFPYLRKPFILTSEELATIYHFPGMVARTPQLTRTEVRKGAPPTNLPI